MTRHKKNCVHTASNLSHQVFATVAIAAHRFLERLDAHPHEEPSGCPSSCHGHAKKHVSVVVLARQLGGLSFAFWGFKVPNPTDHVDYNWLNEQFTDQLLQMPKRCSRAQTPAWLSP